jgi:uncharacterized membrane protein YbhN (UPF0104 family)
VTAITIALFWYYLATHGSIVHQLITTSPLTIVKLLVLYAFWFGTLSLIFQATLKMCNLEIPFGENLLINAYSTFLNYLTPGQGGPILRGIYLKGRYKLPFRRYVLATIMYYLFYAVVSVVLLIGGDDAWRQTIIGVVLVTGAAYAITKFYTRHHKLNTRGLNLSLENLAYMGFVTVLQAVCQVAIYWVELNRVSSGVSLGQVMSYTGAANFALFVNLTPGAVGIRETFLIFSERLHHITNSVIVGTNVLDRATYLVFLGIVFCCVLVVRGRSVFTLRRTGVLTAEMVEGRPTGQPAAETTS